MLGTVIAILLITISTIFAIMMIGLIAKWWVSIVTWSIEFFIGIKII